MYTYEWVRKLKRSVAALLAFAMLFSMLPGIPDTYVHAQEAEDAVMQTEQPAAELELLHQTIPVLPGQLLPDPVEIVENEIYGYVVGYELKKGHVLSISNTDYVFSVRKLVNGNYSTMLKQATVDSFTATEDMTVGMLIRKPDKSALTAEELASVVIHDSQYGMIGVEGYAQRFYVDAETIDGGTAATRCNIFLPASYSEEGAPTKLIVMTNGHSAYLKDNVWNGNTADNVGIIRNYLDAGYAVWVVNNTADSTSRTTDIGCPQLVSSYLKAYEYIQEHFNVEKKFSIHSRSFGTFAAVRIMLEVPELINCAVMTGPRVSIELAWTANKAFVAKRFGFEDTTGATYEADKMVGHDPYTDINGESYSLPPTFWMMSQGDATAEPLKYIEKLTAHGNNVTSATYTGTDHTGICTLNQEHLFADALAFLEQYNAPAFEMQYDDHLDMTGKTVEIIDAGEAILAVEGNYLVATGIGTAKVRIDGQLYDVTVDKAKLNIVVIMGQSNAGNHFANATSDITCPPGTAYWWGNGQGTAATEPVAYTQPSKGFHTPLLAELYAQSVAAGDPVKNVMVWQEGITSKNGQSIVKWASSASNTSGTDATVTMIENCLAYYAQHEDKYEIVGKCVYWLQGESDTEMDPNLYTQCFMAMWSRLKEAGMENLAFLRVRRGVGQNGEDHQDLHHSASLSAQIHMVNENPDMFLATTLTENWVGTADTVHTVDISKYITLMQTYGGSASHTDSYGNDATYADGLLTTTMKTLYGSNNKCHYGKFGYALIGADAAYNMYRALHGNLVEFVIADTSGHVGSEHQHILLPGGEVTVDITDMEEDLTFRAGCGTVAGTLSFKILSGQENISDREGLILASGQHYGAVSVDGLKDFEDVSITVTYTTAEGTAHSVVCNIYCEAQPLQENYIWDFNEDLKARDEEGNVRNSFLEAPLNGSYSLENGYLSGTALQLQLEKLIQLEADKNWSVEWKYGSLENGVAGFLLCEDPANTVGNRAFYHVNTGRLMISDYADSSGYRNYTSSAVTVSDNDCLRITNSFDPDTGKSTMSLWQNGKLVIEDFQLKGSMNKDNDSTDMTVYPLKGEFDFQYLGNRGISTWLVSCELDYLKISFGEVPEFTSEVLSLRFDDHYDVTGKTVEIVDAGTPTSYKVGYGVAEGTLDDAVVTLEGDTLIATGIGTAKVRIDGMLYEITVEAAPISLLLLAGQSNMQGIDGDPAQSVICPDGQVYATYADRYKKTVEDVTKFAPSALTGAYSTLNVTGDTACLENYPVNMLTEAGNGREGMDSGLAYEWVRQTGEKVWVINLGYGGSSITQWQEGGEHYEALYNLFTACQETLRKEIEAGHFTLSHMGYFWCQGCADETQTAKWYVDQFLTMHETFQTKLAFDEASTFTFAGIIPIRAGHSWMGSYRAGAYKDTTTVPYYQSFLDLRFNGPRVAQYWMGNNPDLTDIWNVCTIQEDWATLPDGSDGVAEYFLSAYENGRVDYPVQVAQAASWYMPTTPAAVHDNIHYNQIGYNELGREAARNALILLGVTEAPEVEATVEFVTWDGFTPASQIDASTTGCSGTLVVPMVYPVWRSKEVTYKVSDGLTYEYYDLLTKTPMGSGILSAVGAQGSVAVVSRELTSYCWSFDGSGLVHDASGEFTENGLKLLGGSVADGQFSNMHYQLTHGIRLLHDQLWGVEIELENWTGTVGSMILSTQTPSSGEPYFYFRPSDYFLGIGYYDAGQYHNYGVSLKDKGIDCAQGSHVYRFVNQIGEDGSNSILLVVDGEQIGALTDHYVNSTLTDTDSNWVSGRDFVMPCFGNSSFPLRGFTVNYILACEADYDPQLHIHVWSAWESVLEPSVQGPGVDQRSCTVCGEKQTREVPGVWQTCDLEDHMVELPETFCAGTDLWDVLEHNEYYYHSGEKWAVHESGQVYSVTLAVSGGERLWATSFGRYGENNNTIGTGNGIRVTFFDGSGVCKTMAPEQTYAEFAANGWLAVPEGAVAVNIPMYGNDESNDLYILSQEHDYRGTSCTVCGAEHPEAANYSGKVISILGDSISTFAGYIPVADGFNLEHKSFYPNSVIKKAEQTWWMQTISSLDARLGVNESWSGSRVLNTLDGNSGNLGVDAAMASLTRIQNLGSNGTPDVILFFGGTNDIAFGSPLGSFEPETASTQADLTAVKWETYAEAYTATILRMQYFYPDAKIVAVFPTINKSYYTNDTLAKYCAVMQDICDYYGVVYTDLVADGFTADMLADVTHPNAAGMTKIAESVIQTMMESDGLEAGENVVFSVTHDLTGVTASKHYYKGVSCGKGFTETLTARKGIRVTVTMGGVDITASAYRDGTVSVDAVTGDLVITAKENISQASDYSGKVISILGDSISTFAGYIPTADGFNLEHLARYPQDNLLTDVNETWWMQVITQLDGKLGINDSWRGSTVSGYPSVTTGVAGYLAAMSNLTQIRNLGSNGTPDVILFYGGTNDLAHTPKLGSFDPATAPTQVDLTTLKWDNMADGYVHTLLRLKHFYPDAQIVCLLPTYTASYYSKDKLAQGNALLAAICEHYGVAYVDLRYCGISTADLPDGIHPDATGMDYITAAVLDTLFAQCEIEAGENKVYSVSHTLSNAEASLGYYKGISAGKSFVETLTSGGELKVTVTMGGKDITAECYADGTVSIASVTGDLVITAKADFSLEDRLQQLPDPYYGVNLWPVLEHDADYFYIDEWTVHSSGKVKSVTIPVIPGEKLYASSFEASGTNGSTVNGIRITFFDEDGVLVSLVPDAVYKEFTDKGYVTVPAGANAVNIPMWTDSNSWELYIYDSNYEPSFSLGDHLQQLPDAVCAGMNLWTALDHETVYYNGTQWYTMNGVYSVTIPLNPGDQLWATSFGAKGENGSSTYEGIRVTFFGENGVVMTLTHEEVYTQFVQNGYITAPEGTTAVNVPMWSGSDSNELYILNREHIPGEAVKENEGPHGAHDLVICCSVCGEELSRETVAGYTPGDINGDGSVDNKDLTRLFRHLSGYDVEVVEAALDVNGDGNVNNKDQTRLFRYLSGWDVEIF